MRPTPRTQPYRAGAPRMPGAALQAMLGGRIPGQLNQGDFDRQRRQAASLQQLVQQRLAPRASADVRGNFGGAPMSEGIAVDHWGGPGPVSTIPMRGGDRRAAALHELVLAALQMQRRTSHGAARFT
jgi:hypothetical protein